MNRKPNQRRLLACLLLLLLVLAGCKGDSGGNVFRYDVAEAVDNLDPQFAQSTTVRMILRNLFEGLLVSSADGDLLPGVAEGYSVSSDGLTYTFHLREDAAWSNGDPVTADDFVFTFHRMIRDGSPYAQSFSAVLGAQAVMDGISDASSLGIRADGNHTLVIELAVPDPLLLERLADPAAAPCNQRAYTESRGRYGLDADHVCCNGPFQISRWDDSRLSLERNENYHSDRETVAESVHFYFGRDVAKQFAQGKSDLALLTYEQAQKVDDDTYLQPVTRTLWCIVFNQNDPAFGNALIRQGLAYTVDRETLSAGASPSFQTTEQLVPGGMRVMGKPYRDYAAVATPLSYHSQEGKRLYQMGLDALGFDRLPADTAILVPEEAKTALNVNAIQQGWQKEIAAFFNFEVVSATEIQQRLRDGEYQMMIMPLTPGDSDIETLLGAFTSQSTQNYFGYRSVLYDDLLDAAAALSTPGLAAEKYAQAEVRLLADAVVIPLYFEPSYIAVAKEVSGIDISPFGDSIYFKYARKES